MKTFQNSRDFDMKTTILLLLALMPFLLFGMGKEILVTPELRSLCEAKGDVATFAYRFRNDFSKDQMLAKLDSEWDRVWSKREYSRATYVDMQRIVRDAYRENKIGGYKRECCTEDAEADQAIKEIYACLELQF